MALCVDTQGVLVYNSLILIKQREHHGFNNPIQRSILTTHLAIIGCRLYHSYCISGRLCIHYHRCHVQLDWLRYDGPCKRLCIRLAK
jgi:hypothetical protein